MIFELFLKYSLKRTSQKLSPINIMGIGMTYLWQHPDWPKLTFDASKLPAAPGSRPLTRDQELDFFVSEVIATSLIEGVIVDQLAVRDVVTSQLGLTGFIGSRPDVDGVVQMVMDAVFNCSEPMTLDRLLGWQAALFQDGSVAVGRFRDCPMSVVSARKVHFEAPPADRISAENELLLAWLNQDSDLDPVIRAGLAHLWFETIHPFEDGNGRVGRALSLMLLARAGIYCDLSTRILSDRAGYYRELENAQRGGLDVTTWLRWFSNLV